MKFKELKERIGKMSGSKLTGQEISVYYRENPLAKKAARDPVLKKAIEFALDHGGAMNYAIKNIEKMKRGISRHPQVQQALQFANESNNVQALKDAINEKMSPAEKKKRLDMIRKAVEKLNARADAQAKKDALAAIKSMESVEERMQIGGDFVRGQGIPKKSLLLDDIKDFMRQMKGKKSNGEKFGGINDITIRFSGIPTGEVEEPKSSMDKRLYPNGVPVLDYKRATKHAKDMMGALTKLMSRPPYNVFPKPEMIDDPIQIYAGHQYKGDYKNDPKLKVDLSEVLMDIAKMSFKKEPGANARIKDMGGFFGGMNESVNEEVISEKIQYKGYPTKYAALHGQLGLKTLAQAKAVDHLIVAGGKKPDQIAKIFKNFGPSQFQDIVNLLNVSTKRKDLKDTEQKLKAGFHHENVDEAIDGRRKEFKEKIKKLAYEKMKKMMKAQKENWDISEGIENKERQLNYKLKELEYKMKLKDFMDSVVNSKLPKKNEYKHDKKKKMEEADTVSLKITDTSSTAFNKLSKIARDIGIEFSREENHLLAVGDAKKMEEFKAQMDVAMKESVQVKEGTWQIPDSYPQLVALQKFLKTPHKAKTARDVHKFHIDVDRFYGDDSFSDMLDAYYHTLPGGDIDPYDKEKVSDKMMARAKKYNKIKPGTDLNIVLMKALTDWTAGDMKFKGNKIVQMPRDWYEKDNPKISKPSSAVKAKLERKRPRGNIKYRRQDTIMAQVEESKKTFGDIKNELQERNLRISQLIRKYRDELKKAQRTGNLELSPEAEEDFMIWGMNNGEIATDDPDEFIDWLDTNLDDLVKGRIR